MKEQSYEANPEDRMHERNINWKLIDFRGNLKSKIDWLESLNSWV